MSYIEIFQNSRYIDYDYDTECVFGFNTDSDDNSIIFGNLANKNNSNIRKLKPLQIPIELIGDKWWRKDKHKYKKSNKSKPIKDKSQNTNSLHDLHGLYNTQYNQLLHNRTPSPVSPTTQQIYTIDKFDSNATDKRIKLACSDTSDAKNKNNNYDTIVRSDKSNGELYETHGTNIINTTYKWKFILHDNSQCIIGLIDADIIGKQNMNKYIDINKELISVLFTNGTPKEGCVIQITYDKINKVLLCKNITDESSDFGKEITCVKNINTQKRYKLTVLLKKPSTVTMF